MPDPLTDPQTDGQTKPLIELHFDTNNHLAPGEGGLKIKIHIKKFSERRIQSTFDGNCWYCTSSPTLPRVYMSVYWEKKNHLEPNVLCNLISNLA